MTTATPTREQARTFQARIRSDPAWYCHNVLGCEPYDRQIEMIESVRDREQTSVNGANGVGKDWMIGRIVLWWLHSFAPRAKCIVTGPTFRQIQDIVWRETRGAYHAARYDLGGRILPTEAKWDGGADLFALGFSTDKPENITGFHSENLLVIVSEAHNFREDAMTMLKRLLPTRLLLSGNPFSESGEFYESHHSKRHLYNAITISAWDSPNVRAGSDMVPGVVGVRDIEKMREDWGEESPLYKATVDAEFVGRPDGLIPLSWLLRAQSAAHDLGGPVWAGVDAAGPGEDETVLTIAEAQTVGGEQKDAIIVQKGWRKPEAEGDVIAALLPYASRLQAVGVDSIGLGETWPRIINQALIEAGYRAVARGINVAVAPTSDHNKRNYDRLKDQLYFGLRDRFKDESIIGLSSKASGQLASMRYRNNLRGKKQVESKDEMTKRGVPSPDWGESTMLLFAVMGNGMATDVEDEQIDRGLAKLRESDNRRGDLPFRGIEKKRF